MPAPTTTWTREQLLDRLDGDAFVRWELAPGAAVTVLDAGDALAFSRRTPGNRRSMTIVGSPPAAADLLHDQLRPGGAFADLDGVGAPQGTFELLGPHPAVGRGDDWEWMWLAEPPPAPAVAADELTEADADAVRALLAAASPRHSAVWEDDDVVAWVGVRGRLGDDAGLVAVAAHTEHVPGVPHLASIAVHPRARGRGLGAAVTAAVSRRALALGAPVVTLGMYSDNDVARRMYHRLGFTCRHRWSHRAVLPPPSPH